MNVTAHHIGCAVKEFAASYATYGSALGLTRRTRSFDVSRQDVRVCFVELVNGFYLELITALNEKAKLASFLKTGFYHLCFLVDDLNAARVQLREKKFYPLPEFQSEAFAGHRCQFFLTPERHLIELAEMSSSDFQDFFRANLEAS